MAQPSSSSAGSTIASPRKAAVPRSLGLQVKLSWRSHLRQPSGPKDGDLVGEGQCFGLIVGDQDGRDAGGRRTSRHRLAHAFAEVGVERGEGLVEQHQFAAGGRGRGRAPRAAAGRRRAREGGGRSILRSSSTVSHQLQDARAPSGHSARSRPKPMFSATLRCGKQSAILRHKADAAPMRRHHEWTVGQHRARQASRGPRPAPRSRR